MVKSFGGNKTKRKGRKNFRSKTFSLDDLKASKEDNQEYGYVTEKYGDGRYQIMCYDKVTRKASMRGALRQKNRLEKGGLVLISLREFQDTHSDILYVYTEEDKEKLINAKVICESFTKTGKLSTEEDSNSESDNDDSMYPPDVKSYGSDVEVWESDSSDKEPGEKQINLVSNDSKNNKNKDLGEMLDDLELDIDDI